MCGGKVNVLLYRVEVSVAKWGVGCGGKSGVGKYPVDVSVAKWGVGRRAKSDVLNYGMGNGLPCVPGEPLAG